LSAIAQPALPLSAAAPAHGCIGPAARLGHRRTLLAIVPTLAVALTYIIWLALAPLLRLA
jgi:hypothetical protein